MYILTSILDQVNDIFIIIKGGYGHINFSVNSPKRWSEGMQPCQISSGTQPILLAFLYVDVLLQMKSLVNEMNWNTQFIKILNQSLHITDKAYRFDSFSSLHWFTENYLKYTGLYSQGVYVSSLHDS